MKKFLAFDDVLLLPQFSYINSRADVDTSQVFCGFKLGLPILSSNMDSVTNSKMANAMKTHGAGSALHRFNSVEENVREYLASPESTIGSFGLGAKELGRAINLAEAGCTTLMLDVAHGATMMAVNQVKALRLNVSSDVKIIVGNFASAMSIEDFCYHLGGRKIDAVKVGIGGGASCLTRVQTGSGASTFSSVVDCVRTGIPVISDGGHRNPGDISKALAAGAKVVMLGKMLSGTDEAPGEVINCDHADYDTLMRHKELNLPTKGSWKKYRGSASQESYEVQGKVAEHRVFEGDSFLVPAVGPVAKVLQEINGGLRSAMSYSGAMTLNDFRERAEFIEVTSAGAKESESHGRDKK